MIPNELHIFSLIAKPIYFICTVWSLWNLTYLLNSPLCIYSKNCVNINWHFDSYRALKCFLIALLNSWYENKRAYIVSISQWLTDCPIIDHASVTTLFKKVALLGLKIHFAVCFTSNLHLRWLQFSCSCIILRVSYITGLL